MKSRLLVVKYGRPILPYQPDEALALKSDKPLRTWAHLSGSPSLLDIVSNTSYSEKALIDQDWLVGHQKLVQIGEVAYKGYFFIANQKV